MEFACVVVLLLLIGIPAIAAIMDAMEKRDKERIAADKAAAEKEWQRNNPELWKAQQLVELERERLRLAEERDKHNRTTDHISAGLVAGRWFGWW